MTRRGEPCPIPGCLDPKARGHLMCRKHWRLAHPKLRHNVNRCWKTIAATPRVDFVGRIAAIRAWREAAVAATQFVCQKENIHVTAAS